MVGFVTFGFLSKQRRLCTLNSNYVARIGWARDGIG